MIGETQNGSGLLRRALREVTRSFTFIISTVPMMIPHSGAGGVERPIANKQRRAWTGFIDEREDPNRRVGRDGKKVFRRLTGRFAQQFRVKVTDNVWEFVCGPHNRRQSRPSLDEERSSGDRFCSNSDRRQCDFRLEQLRARGPCHELDPALPATFCVVQVTNRLQTCLGKI